MFKSGLCVCVCVCARTHARTQTQVIHGILKLNTSQLRSFTTLIIVKVDQARGQGFT